MTLSRLRRRPARAQARERGQTLVEFALVFPLFLLLVLSVVEFAFAFNANLAIAFASRDAALVAAEAGGVGTATQANKHLLDCSIVKAVIDDMGAPADATKVSTIEIYKSDSNGAYFGGNSSLHNIWTYGTPTLCDFPVGIPDFTIPYSITTTGYAENQRCNVLKGCAGLNTTVDTIGVRVNYTYIWKTPLHYFGGLFGAGSGWDFSRSNAMRMEPVL